MFDMGFLELALIAGIGLIVLGPERLPVAARTIGRYIGQIRRFVGNFQRQIEQESRLEELNKRIMEETQGQSFTNNDGTTSEPDSTEKPERPKRQPIEDQPGYDEAVAKAKARWTDNMESPPEAPASAAGEQSPEADGDNTPDDTDQEAPRERK